jgi:hypothetical protein
MYHVRDRREMHTEYYWETVTGRERLGDLDVDG